jgi:hypothetical protein
VFERYLVENRFVVCLYCSLIWPVHGEHKF